MLLIVIALAQPRWGRLPGGSGSVGHDVVIVMDVSRSMAAEDAVPNRLGAAVESAESLIEAVGRSEGERVAVVAFAGRGVVKCPLTDNFGAAVAALKALRPGGVRPGGTDFGAAIETAIDAFDDEPKPVGWTIVLFSDGEDHTGSWRPDLDRLRSLGVLVHAVALGDRDRGATVPTESQRPLVYRGRPVLSQRRDESLRALAEATGGAFVPLGLKSADLGALYREKIGPIARRRREQADIADRPERFNLFVLSALAIGLVGSLPLRRWVVGSAAVVMFAGAGPIGESAQDRVEQGRAAFAARSFASALASFESAIALAPESPLPRYGAAATLFQLGRFDEAEARYIQARDRADDGLRLKIDYALGNVALARGDVPASVRHYDTCLASTSRGPTFDAVRRSAAINRAFALAHARPGDDPHVGSRPGDDEPRSPSKAADRDPAEPDSTAPDGRGNPSASPPSSPRPANSGSPTALRGTPGQRLEAALNSIRRGHRRRLDDEPPESKADADRKDW